MWKNGRKRRSMTHNIGFMLTKNWFSDNIKNYEYLKGILVI